MVISILLMEHGLKVLETIKVALLPSTAPPDQRDYMFQQSHSEVDFAQTQAKFEFGQESSRDVQAEC